MHQKKNLSNLSKSAKGSASSGRVLLMASLRFGQSKEPSRLMAPAWAHRLMTAKILTLKGVIPKNSVPLWVIRGRNPDDDNKHSLLFRVQPKA